MYVKTQKHLGQHFLTDLSVAKRIADSLRADRCPRCSKWVRHRRVMFLLERTDTPYGAEVDPESVAYFARALSAVRAAVDRRRFFANGSGAAVSRRGKRDR